MICVGHELEEVILDHYVVTLKSGRTVGVRALPALQCAHCDEVALWPDVSRVLIHLAEVSETDEFGFPSTAALDPDEIQAVRRDLMLSQERMAALLGTQKSTYALWEQGQQQPTGPSRLLLRLMSILAQPISGASEQGMPMAVPRPQGIRDHEKVRPMSGANSYGLVAVRNHAHAGPVAELSFR